MSLLDLPVRRPVAVGMVFVALSMLGIVGIERLPVELMPALQGDSVHVQFYRRGADPEVVEREILLPLHARVSALPLVKESFGYVRGAGGSYDVEFEPGGDIKVRELEVGRIAAALQRAQPRNTTSLQVSSTESATASMGSFVMMVNVLGPTDRDTLFDLTDELLVPRFAALPGVSEAFATGGARRQVTVRLDLDRGAAAGVTPEEAVNAVRGHVGQTRFVGSLESEGGRTDVVVDGRPPGLGALRDARVATDSPAQLGHVADVEFGFAPKQSSFRVNGEPAVGIVVFQEQDANLIELGRTLRAEVGRIRGEVEPLGLDLVIGTDAGEAIEEQIGHLWRLGISGYLIALGVLFLFLRQWRAVAVVGLAVPVSVLAALALLYVFGQTLNVISLVGMALSVGLLIDNSIVVYEAVLRRLERGLPAAEAVRIGVRRTVRAIAAASLTTAIVFLPTTLVDLPTTTRSMIEILAISFLLPLAASMLVAVGLVPVLAHRLAAPAATERVARLSAVRARAGGLRAPDPARILFTGIVASALRRPSALLAVTLFAVLATLVFAVPIALAGSAPADAENADEVRFVTRSAKGRSTIEALTAAVERVEDALTAIPGIETVTSDLSDDGASITVALVDRGERPRDLTTSRIRDAAQEAAKKIEGFELLRPGEQQQGGGDRGKQGRGGGADPTGAPQQVVLSGPETGPLDRLARDLVARLETVPGIARVWRFQPPGMEEIWVEPRRAGFEAFGLNVGEVLPFLGMVGREGQTIGRGFMLPTGRELPVVVERDGARDEHGARDLRRLRLHTDNGIAPVAALASVRQMPPPPLITHHNGRRETSVYYRLTGDVPSTGSAAEAMRKEIAAVVHSVPKPPGYTVEISDENEATDTFRKLALPAVLLVIFVLAMAFESLTLPVIVVLSWPLAILGACWLLVLTDTPVTIMTGAGVIVLFGLAVNPAILLVDRMQQRIRGGWSVGAAALASVRERTRPVLMTSATTIGALWPLALATGRENEMWPPFATVVIGGIATVTVLTLVITPVAFILLRRLDTLFGRVGPWLVVGWFGATLAAILSLTLTDVITSIVWQIVTSLLIGSGLLAATVLLFRRREQAEPHLADGPPELEVRNLRKVYGLPGALKRAIRAPREHAREVLAAGGSLAGSGRFVWRDAVGRFGPPAILVGAPLALSYYVQGGGWTLMLWLLAAGFAGRLANDIRRARGLGNQAGGVRPGGVEAVLRISLPWVAVLAFAYWMQLAPYLAGEPFKAALVWPVLAALLVGAGQMIRLSAVRQIQGRLPARATTGPLRYPRTLIRRWARRIGGFDLPSSPVEALTAVDFRVTQGMVGILGPNGAGKTTLLRQLAGILDPTRGTIWLGGAPLAKLQRRLAHWVGYLPQDAGMPGGLSAREYLAYFAALYDLAPDIRAERVAGLLAEVGLAEKADDPIKSLSGGMRQRVAVARTLLRLPPVIIVDEPTVGLDPRERIRFRNLLARLARDRIVLFSTHVVEDVAVACERVLVLARGRLVFDGDPATLAEAAQGRVWRLKGSAAEPFRLPRGAILAEEAPMPDGSIVRRVVADAPPAEDAAPVPATLEDGYLRLISGGDEAPSA